MGKGQKKKGQTMSLAEFAGDQVVHDPYALPTAPKEDRSAPPHAPSQLLLVPFALLCPCTRASRGALSPRTRRLPCPACSGFDDRYDRGPPRREGDRYDRGGRSYENEDGEMVRMVSQADEDNNWRGGGGDRGGGGGGGGGGSFGGGGFG